MREGWDEKPLEEAVDIRMGQSPPGASYNTRGAGLPFIQGSAEFGSHHPSPVKWCDAPLKVAEAGDILLSVRAPVGDTNVADQRIAVGRGIAVLRASGEHSITPFIRLLLEFSSDRLAARSSSGMFQSITGAALRSLPVLLPPLPEQRRIVDLIGALDDTIAAADRATGRARAQAASLRAVCFANLYRDADTVPASSIFDMRLGRQKSSPRHAGEHTIPYLRAANISNDGFRLADVQHMRFSDADQVTYALQPGDVMLVEGGSVGQSAVWSQEISGPVGFDKHVIRLRAREGASTVEYIRHWVRWADESGAFDAQATGVTIRALGFGRASAMPVPSIPVERQHELLAPLGAAEGLVANGLDVMTGLRDLRINLLTALLSGEHAIPDSYDELLEVAA